MIAAIIKTRFNYSFYLLGIINHNYPGLILQVLLKAPNKTHSFGHFMLGMFIDSVIGGTLGIVIIYGLILFGRRYLWYKGIFLGSLFWLFGPVITLPHLQPQLSFSFYYISLLYHWILGFVIITLIQRLYPLHHTNLRSNGP
jgi:hypothetical protein